MKRITSILFAAFALLAAAPALAQVYSEPVYVVNQPTAIAVPINTYPRHVHGHPVYVQQAPVYVGPSYHPQRMAYPVYQAYPQVHYPPVVSYPHAQPQVGITIGKSPRGRTYGEIGITFP